MSTDTKNDSLAIPDFLKRKPGAKPAVKPAAATKPAVVKAPATKPAAKTKPLTGKQLAQQRAGVKVTAPVAPAKPVEPPKASTPAAPVVAEPKPGKAPKDLVKAVKAHAKKFAHQNGWDIIVELWSDADIEKVVTGLSSKRAAIQKMRDVAKALDKKRPAKKA
jgi:hypothetical protein